MKLAYSYFSFLWNMTEKGKFSMNVCVWEWGELQMPHLLKMWEVKCEVSYQSIRNSGPERGREDKSELLLVTAVIETQPGVPPHPPHLPALSAPLSASAQPKYSQADLLVRK